jgi:dTDP-4-amino-4,6-dideoxygalactose transaminase
MTTYRIPFNRPARTGCESAYINEALASGRLSGNGPFTHRAQELLQQATGARAALLTTSCTHALEMSAMLLDLRAGDEVIVPSFTFVSTANAFAVHGAVPVFADCRADTLNIDDGLIETLISPRTRAIVVMHYGGVACEMDAISALASRHGLAIVEDNAHGLFGTYHGRALGTLGVLATQSFHETKNVTAGEGGALLLNDLALVDRAEVIREKGTNRNKFFRGGVDKYTWVDTGSNFLMSELQAAHLCAQLESACAIQARRRDIWQRYHTELASWREQNSVAAQHVPPYCEHPAHASVLIMPTHAAQQRLIAHLRERSILAVFHYLALNASEQGRKLGAWAGQCPVAESIGDRLVRLPLFYNLTDDDQTAVIDAVTSCVV